MDVGFTASNKNIKSVRDCVKRNAINQLEQISWIADVEKSNWSYQYAKSVKDTQAAIQDSNIELLLPAKSKTPPLLN